MAAQREWFEKDYYAALGVDKARVAVTLGDPAECDGTGALSPAQQNVIRDKMRGYLDVLPAANISFEYSPANCVAGTCRSGGYRQRLDRGRCESPWL